MKKGNIKLQTAIFTFILLIFFSCDPNEKSEEPENIIPTCTITSPANGNRFELGEIVSIVVEAEDSDGNIENIELFIDNKSISILTSEPYKFNWNTSDFDIGSHLIQVFATDNNQGIGKDSITLKIKSNDTSNVEDPITTKYDTISDIDGNNYKTLEIGNQVWMAENLRVTRYADSTRIPLVQDITEWKNLGDNNTDKAYCWYNNDISNKQTYGALYTWAAAMNGDCTEMAQGACPDGWHLPSTDEWIELENYLIANKYNYDGSTSVDKLGKSLASKTSWSESSEIGDVGNNQQNNNSTGFSAFPSGFRDCFDGSFRRKDYDCAFWTSNEDKSNNAWSQQLGYNIAGMIKLKHYKAYGLSVRCIKD